MFSLLSASVDLGLPFLRFFRTICIELIVTSMLCLNGEMSSGDGDGGDIGLKCEISVLLKVNIPN